LNPFFLKLKIDDLTAKLLKPPSDLMSLVKPAIDHHESATAGTGISQYQFPLPWNSPKYIMHTPHGGIPTQKYPLSVSYHKPFRLSMLA